jgi:hypothetical protein
MAFLLLKLMRVATKPIKLNGSVKFLSNDNYIRCRKGQHQKRSFSKKKKKSFLIYLIIIKYIQNDFLGANNYY